LSSSLRPAHGKPLLVLPLWTTLLWLVVVGQQQQRGLEEALEVF
jgi:hypothetical protein